MSLLQGAATPLFRVIVAWVHPASQQVSDIAQDEAVHLDSGAGKPRLLPPSGAGAPGLTEDEYK